MVANHASFLDSVAVLAAIPGEYRFVVNHRAARRPLLGTIIRKSGHLVVDRRSGESRVACARAIVRTLQSGTSLVLFPEGTRSRNGVQPFRLGAFRAAARTSRTVVPIAIDGTDRMLPPDRWLPSPTRLAVHVLSPLESDGISVRDSQSLRDSAHQAIIAVLAESHGILGHTSGEELA